MYYNLNVFYQQYDTKIKFIFHSNFDRTKMSWVIN